MKRSVARIAWTTVVLMAVTTIAVAQQPVVYLGSANLLPGETITIPFGIREGTEPYAAVTASFTLSAGLSLQATSAGANLPEGYDFDSNVYEEAGQNFVALTAFSSLGVGTFTGDAELLLLEITAAAEATRGDRALDLQSSTALSNLDGTVSITPTLESAVVGVVAFLDTDGDGLDDAWEEAVFGNLGQGSSDDADGDGLTNFEEWQEGTDPNVGDTDADGLSDFDELNIHGTLPTTADSDGDGYDDAQEIAAGTDPNDGTDCTTTGGTTVTASEGTSFTGVQLSWNAVPRSTQYQVLRSTTDDFASATLLTTLTETTYEDTTADPPTIRGGCNASVIFNNFYYWVVPTNVCGEGDTGTPALGFVGEAPTEKSILLKLYELVFPQ